MIKDHTKNLQALSEHIPAGIGIFDVYSDGRAEQVYMNNGYYKSIGRKREDREFYFGFHALNAVHPDDLENVKETILDAERKTNSFSLETRIIVENGLYKWFSIQANPIRKNKGKVTFYCVFTDVHQLKLSKIYLEEEKKEKERQTLMMRNVLYNLPGAVATFEIDQLGTHLTYISAGCVDISGYTAEETLEMCKQDAFFFTHPEDRVNIIEVSKQKAKSDEQFSQDFRVVTKDGSFRWVRLRLSPVKTADRLCYYGIYLDITSEHEANEVQKRLTDSLPGGIVVYKISDKIETTYFSDGILRLCGYTKEEYEELVKDDPIENLIYEDDRQELRDRIAKSLKESSPILMTLRIISNDGSVIWVQLSATMIERHRDAQTYYAIFTRLTEEAEIYKNIAENSNVAIFIAERSTRKLIFANRAWKELRLIDPEKNVIGKRLTNLLPKGDVLYTDEQLLNLPSDHFVESHTVSSRGQYLSISGRAIDWSGYNAYVCYISDETKLGTSRKKLQELIDRIPGGVSIYEVDSTSVNLIFVNRAIHSLIGDTTRFCNEKAVDFVHPEDRRTIKRVVAKLRHGENHFDIHIRMPSFDNVYTWIRVVGSVVERTGPKMMVYCCYSDFNEIMKTQEEMQKNRAMVDAAMISAKVLAWRYDYRKKAFTDTGSLGDFADLPKVIENVPESVIEQGFIHKDSIETYRKMFEKIPEEKTVTSDICICVHNKECWHRQIYTPVFDNEGNYVESIGTSIDVTEQKEREKAYEEQIRLKRLITNNAIGVTHINLTDNIVTDSDSRDNNLIRMMREGTADDALLRIMNNAGSEQEKALFDKVNTCQKLINMFGKGKSKETIRHHLKNDDRWVETIYNLVMNPYTQDLEAIIVLGDITELVIAEQIVKVLVDIDYESITTINAKTGEAKPFTRGHMDEVIKEQKKIGDNVKGVEAYLKKYCDDLDVQRIIRETSLPFVKKMLEKNSVHMVTYSLRQGGQTVHKRVIYTYLEDNKKYILCAMQDTTDTYKHELEQKRQLTVALTDAEQANKAKTEFFSRMSHDMRTPMNGILGFAQLSENENDIDVMRDNIEKIRESGEYLLSLINDTLDWQKIESGKMILDEQVVWTPTLLENIVDIIRPTAAEKKVKFTLDTHNVDDNWYIRADSVRLKQIFINLLSNAIKFTPEGGSVHFELFCDGREGLISHDRILIKDTGVGMTEEFIKYKLYQPFSQEHNRYSESAVGSGLGLSIVRKLIDLMGGRIEVESTLHEGTTFTVYLDFVRVNPKEVDTLKQDKEDNKSQLKDSLDGINILIVEDHPINAKIAKKLLENMNCNVTWVDNGEKGVQAFKNSAINEFDVILMDIRMPVLNGIEATKMIRSLSREDAKTVVIIAMTANAYDEDVKNCLDAGMNSHLSKPVDSTKLYQTIVKAIE